MFPAKEKKIKERHLQYRRFGKLFSPPLTEVGEDICKTLLNQEHHLCLNPFQRIVSCSPSYSHSSFYKQEKTIEKNH